MGLKLANITFDCADPARLAAFWSAVLDRPADPQAVAGFASIDFGDPDRVTWLFLKVPEPKAAKNRCHPDLATRDRVAEVARLVGLGATEVETHQMFGLQWTVLLDPEGNEFCVAQPPRRAGGGG